MASKLEQHKKVITELREQGKSYDIIADYLLNKHDLKVNPSTIHSFVKRREKDREEVSGKNRTNVYMAEILEDVKGVSGQVREWKENQKEYDRRRTDDLEEYRRMKEGFEKGLERMEEIHRQVDEATGFIGREGDRIAAGITDIKRTMAESERILREKYSPYRPLFYSVVFMCSFAVMFFYLHNRAYFTRNLYWYHYGVFIAGCVFFMIIGCMLAHIKRSIVQMFEKEEEQHGQ